MLKKILTLLKNMVFIILTIATLTQTYLYPAKIHRGSFATQDGNLIDIYEITSPILNKTQVVFSNTYKIFYKKYTGTDLQDEGADIVQQHLWNMDSEKHYFFAAYTNDKCIGWEYFEKTSPNILTSKARCFLEMKNQKYLIFSPFLFMPNINIIIVKCNPKNTNAIMLYERLGFRYCGTYPRSEDFHGLSYGLSITKNTFERLYQNQSFFDTFMSCC
ncbi:MAG: hypothetical protein V1646_03085 [bacterium]